MNWQSLGAAIARQLQLPMGAVSTPPIRGGNINQAFRFELGKHHFFVKTNRAERLPMFVAEQAGLAAIRQSRSIRVPEVFLTGTEDDHAYIVMEYIAFGGSHDAGRLAAALAAMHGSFHPRFGFHCDNTIGSTPQSNTFTDDWVEFWRGGNGLKINCSWRRKTDLILS